MLARHDPCRIGRIQDAQGKAEKRAGKKSRKQIQTKRSEENSRKTNKGQARKKGCDIHAASP